MSRHAINHRFGLENEKLAGSGMQPGCSHDPVSGSSRFGEETRYHHPVKDPDAEPLAFLVKSGFKGASGSTDALYSAGCSSTDTINFYEPFYLDGKLALRQRIYFADILLSFHKLNNEDFESLSGSPQCKPKRSSRFPFPVSRVDDNQP